MLNRALSLVFLAAIPPAIGQSAPPATVLQPSSSRTITYTNAQYRFRFILPQTWKGFTILGNLTWQGTLLSPKNETAGQIQGPALAIRNPLWTKADPHEDIPIYIFTHAQWSMIQTDRLGIGAAPIPPAKLGRNAHYVFALPARYNFDYSTGWEKVEKILATKPLQAF